MSRNADLNEVLFFTTIVECGSITGAAERLGLQKSTVSRKLASMESRLEIRLLSRTTRSLTLTETGQAHYRRCKAIIQAWQEAEHALSNVRNEPSGSMRILMPIDLGQRLMIHIINEFLSLYPKVSIEAELSTREPRFIEEGLDIAFRIGEPHNPSLVARKLFSTERSLFASPALLKQYNPVIHPKQLSDLPGINLYTTQTHKQWTLKNGTATYQHTPNGRFSVNNLSCCLDTIIAGIGVGCLPNFLCQEALDQGGIVQLLPEWTMENVEVYVLYPQKQFTSFSVRHFIAFTQEKLATIDQHFGNPKKTDLYSSFFYI